MFNNELWQKPAGGAGGAGFYTHQIANSLRGHYNSRLQQSINSAASSGTKVAISFWHKMANAGTATGTTGLFTGFANETNIVDLNIQTWGTHSIVQSFQFSTQDGSGSYGCKWADAGSQRDPSAFKHIVLILDSTQGTSTDRAKLYINGDQKTTSNTLGAIPLNYTWQYTKNGSTMNIIERYSSGYGNVFDGYLSEVVLIDGAAAISDFGETKNGVWIPKDPSGLTFGNNGYYLKFESSSDLGNDSSGNNNDFTVSNLSAHDQMLDSPTFNSDSNGGNFATMNPLSQGSYATLSEGNLKVTGNTGADVGRAIGNMASTTGKWYFEINMEDVYAYIPSIGLRDVNSSGGPGGLTTGPMQSIGIEASGGLISNSNNLNNMGTLTTTSTGVSSFSDGDIMMIAWDLENRKMWIGKNGTFYNSGNPASGSNPQFSWTAGSGITALTPWVGVATNGSDAIFNFGQDGTFAGTKTAQGNSDDTGYGNFYYDPPTGYLALCSGNLPVADAVDPAQTDDDYPQKLFGALPYTGDGGTNAITGLGFQPDFVWIKERSGANNHMLFDSTRGVSRYISSNTNGDQGLDSATMNTFGSDGFTVGSDGKVNNSSDTYISFNWRANGGTTSSGSGDLTSTHQVDPSGGFSIVKAVGDGGSGDKTVSHGLSAAPTVILAKDIDASRNWDTYWSEGLTSGYGLRLNTTDNQLSGRWGTVNSSIFTCKDSYTWGGTDNYIYYCFTDTEGYIKSGTYVGNGNDNGTFVYTGFRPAVMLLREIAVDDWLLYNNKTLGYNLDSAGNAQVYPNTDVDEENQASRAIDILSNGFKLRTSNATGNAGSGNYVYLALAKNPFKYATAR